MNTWFSGSIGRRASVIVALTFAVSASAAAASGGAEQHARPKPNLVVKAGRLSVPAAPDTGFAVTRRDTTVFAWNERTKNNGTAPARNSRTALEIQFAPRVRVIPGGAHLRVPRLAPAKSSADNGAFTMSWNETWEYGTHPTRICADADQAVNESRESDNCRKTHDIYVVPVAFRGSVTGSAAFKFDPGVTLSWSAIVSFNLADAFPQPGANNGIFKYHYIGPMLGIQDVFYKVSGTSSVNGCSFQGTAHYLPKPDSDYIDVAFGRGSAGYHAEIAVDPGFGFTADGTCPSGQSTTLFVEPAQWSSGSWFDTRNSLPFPDPGLEKLAGSSFNETSLTTTSWTWDLVPNDTGI